MKRNTLNIIGRILMISILVFLYHSMPVEGVSTNVTNKKKDILESNVICYVLLEPLQPGQTTSNIIEIQCGNDAHKLDSELNSAYFIASFFDKINFKEVLIQYYGPSLCSDSISYGIAQLSETVDNRISSGSGYSGCNNIYVYDLPNFSGDSASCFANCSSFGTLNDRVSSWKVTN